MADRARAGLRDGVIACLPRISSESCTNIEWTNIEPRLAARESGKDGGNKGHE
jgi:hypothetical protein